MCEAPETAVRYLAGWRRRSRCAFARRWYDRTRYGMVQYLGMRCCVVYIHCTYKLVLYIVRTNVHAWRG